MPVSRTNVPSALSVLLPSAEVSRFAWGSSVPQVERSLVFGRSSLSFSAFACLSVAAFLLTGLCLGSTFEFLSIPRLASFALVARGSTIGLESRKHFVR